LVWKSNDYSDSTRLTGPWLGTGAAWRMLTRFPLTARIGAGVALLRANTSNSGVFTTIQSDRSQALTRLVSIPEQSDWLATPFVSSELRGGYRFNERFSADIGIALTLFMPESSRRLGTDDTFGNRSQALPDMQGDTTKPGVISLPQERVTGTFLALVPTVALRVDL
jgi:hypothetical protein